MTHGMERVPDSLGYLVINDDGAVFASGGDLENDEAAAGRISGLVHTALRVPLAHHSQKFKRLSVMWDGFFYAITVSNSKIYVSKRRHISHEPVTA